MKKISKNESQAYGKQGLRACNYPLPDVNGGLSIVHVESTTEHGECAADNISRIYYVLEGSGEFVINGEKLTVQAGDVVVVPPRATYNYWPTQNSTLKCILYMEYFTVK
jgi:mannose-6-phosphate isomerase-like protein (cupin superfamily)